MNKLSVITINLNNVEGLQKTILSVTSQKYKEFEYIIVDGGSIDGSREIIEFYSDRIIYWISEKDTGIYNAMNKGILHATGEYLLFLNSGDFLVDQEVLGKVAETEKYADILIGNIALSKNGTVVHTVSLSEEITFKNFYNQNIPHQATFIKRELFDRYGLYNEDYKLYGDLEFWIRTIISNNCSVQKLNLLISDYNLGGLSSNPEIASTYSKEIESILSKYIPLRILNDYKSQQVFMQSLEKVLWLSAKRSRQWMIGVLYQIAKKLTNLHKNTTKAIQILSEKAKTEMVFSFKSLIISSIIEINFRWKLYHKKPVIILAWHQVSANCIKGLNNPHDWTSAHDFEKSIRYLLRKKFVLISLKEATDILSLSRKRKCRYIVITFDDGYVTLNETLPLLEKYNVPATFFINSAYLNGNTVSWTDIQNFVDSAEDLSSIPGAVKASLKILKTTNNPKEYDFFRKIAEKSYPEFRNKNRLYITREELFAINNPLFTIGLHGHEHEHHTCMPPDWCRNNIEVNYTQLKSHPNFVPFIAFPFGAFSANEAIYWEEQGFKTVGCNGMLNFGKSNQLNRVAMDGKVVSIKSLAHLSGESFSFKRFLGLKK
jgi:glycosyltransferase involved in cell wall biosynthesis/peptidoglycan/xylan/chitin deacetylase (PgdA/CDA1 family)